jgi:PAS domain S-box-containing protein
VRIDSFMSGEAIDRVTEFVFLMAPDGAILDANSAALEGYGYTRAEMLSLNIRDIRALQGQDDIERQMSETALEGTVFQTRHLRSDGSRLDVEVRFARVSKDGERALLSLVRDVSDRTGVEAQLAAFALHNEALLEATREGIHVLDREGYLVDANRAFCEMLGYEREALLHMHVSDWDAQWSADELMRRVTSLFERPALLETRHRRMDGTVRDVEISGVGVTLDGRDYLYVSARDITDRKREAMALMVSENRYRELSGNLEALVQARTRELERSTEQLEQALEIEHVFLAGVSHELRTPLNSIIGFSALLESGAAGELPPEAHKQAGFVNESGRQLLAVVETLLDSTAIVAGVVRPIIAPFDVDGLIDSVEAAMAPQFRGTPVAFSIARPGGSLMLESDEVRIREILFKLVGNANKFTATGSVTLAVSLDDQTWRFEVTDTGVGIDTCDLGSIMEPFRQLPQEGVAKTRGAGLGLAICEKIAEALGGAIEVESCLGVGSTFTLALPAVVH